MAVHITCGNKPLTIPTTGCDDCSELEERVEALEQCCDDVHTELDDKADKDETEEAIERIEAQLNSLVAGWHYINDIPSSEDLPTTFEEGEVYYSTADNGFYVSLIDRTGGGGTLSDWGFLSSEPDTKYDLVMGSGAGALVGEALVGDAVLGGDDAAISLVGSDGTTDTVHFVGSGGVTVTGSGDTITIGGGSSATSLTVTLEAAGWSDDSQTVTATGVEAGNSIIISPDPASIDDYSDAGIYCSAQGTDSLTFECATTPSNDIDVNVLIL